MNQLIILGAGGHGAVVAEAAVLSRQWDSVAFLDDNAERESKIVGCPVLGTTTMIADLLGSGCEFFVAIGDNRLRREFQESIVAKEGALGTVIHPKAIVSPSARVESGSIVCAGVVINARARVGCGAIINTGASIDHDCEIGRFVHVSPGAHLAGCVTIGDESWVGIGSVVKEGVTIGSNCTIGAGSAVISNIESGKTVMGVPAK